MRDAPCDASCDGAKALKKQQFLHHMSHVTSKGVIDIRMRARARVRAHVDPLKTSCDSAPRDNGIFG